MKQLFTTFAVFAVATMVSSSANAQYQDPRSPKNQFTPTPTVSPYLDLLRGGGGPGFNYQTLVRPRLDLQNQLQNQRVRNDESLRQQQQINLQQQREVEAMRQQQRQFTQSPFTLPFANPATGAAQSIRPTGQGRPINYTTPITGHTSSRMRLQRSTGQPYFTPIVGRR